MALPRDWDGKEWEKFSRRLVQVRHGPENVQYVPDRVRGDAGIEFFTSDGCCYQSYAPGETAHTAKAASAMKQKATRDIGKLDKNRTIIGKILGSIKIRRWILLCPFLDDKAVISHLRLKEESIVSKGLNFLDSDFRAFVQSPSDFEREIEILRKSSTGVPLRIEMSSDQCLAGIPNDIRQRVEEKLKRAYPHAEPQDIAKRANTFIKSDLTRSNLLENLKLNFPDLWETARRTVELEEQRLEMLGAGDGAPNDQLRRGLDRLESTLQGALPSLCHSEIVAMANGQLGGWLVECPLDFSDGSS